MTLTHLQHGIYSGTSLNRHSQKWPPCLCGHFDAVLVEEPLLQYLRILQNVLFREVDSFFGPCITWTVQNLLDNMDAHMPLTQDCPPSLSESTTTALVRLVQASC